MTVYLNPQFDDLPILVVPSMQFPQHDGDMAELHELADRVCDGVADGGVVSTRPSNEYWFRATMDVTWIDAHGVLAHFWRGNAPIESALREWPHG